MPVIDGLASWPHYLAHVLPVFRALPPERRGVLYVDDERLAAAAERAGVEATVGYPLQQGGPVIVAGHSDATQCHPDRPLIYLEHGAGQTYAGVDSPSYSGGPDRARVALFLTLNDRTAARERERYPDRAVEVIGSPRLDDLSRIANGRGCAHPTSAPPVVAFCWHANMKITRETRETYSYWWPALRALHGSGAYQILGHGHPREWRKLRSWYERAGIEATDDFTEIVARADLVCVDNSSTGPEFAAATGKPVLWLDHPRYRRDLEQGGRFWDWPQGQVSCEDPERLPQRIALALADPHDVYNARQTMVDHIYPPHTRGRATELAITAIHKHAERLQTP